MKRLKYFINTKYFALWLQFTNFKTVEKEVEMMNDDSYLNLNSNMVSEKFWIIFKSHLDIMIAASTQ